MAVTYNQGALRSSDVTVAATSADVGQAPDRRRLYNFGDRVADLAPEESPFFVYLSKVAKVPTDDSVFRYLENRTKINWTSRNFYVDGSPTGAVAAGTSYAFTVDDAASSPASIDWLVKGMVFSVNTVDSAAGWSQSIFRIESAPSDNGSDTSFTGKCIEVSNSNVSGYATLADNDQCQVIGTSFAEGSGAPDVWSAEIEDNYGYTQIFKTAAEMTGTALATRCRGYADEFQRIWAEKLREHKVDIERAMLFGQKARVTSVQYTEGIVGHVVKNTNPTVDDSDLSFSSGKAYYRSVAQSELTYDRLLSDLEVIFDPARGGSGDRLVLCSLPVVSFFNKLGDGNFLYESLQSGTTNVTPFRWNYEEKQGAFGHRVMVIDTIHGRMHLVKEPLFRGIASGFMLMADMSNCSYRPLVGNGTNRDTHVITNVQNDDEDLRKDMILTEAGLEVTLPESHALYNVESL